MILLAVSFGAAGVEKCGSGEMSDGAAVGSSKAMHVYAPADSPESRPKKKNARRARSVTGHRFVDAGPSAWLIDVLAPYLPTPYS